MSQSGPRKALLVAVLTLAASVVPACAEPLFTLTEDGRTFLYKARPGENPGIVAEMFGIPAHDLPAFLAANHITDPTRVGAGFTYRIPNAAAQGLADRVAALEQENAGQRRSLAEVSDKTRALTRAADDAHAAAAQAEHHAQQLERLASLWPWLRLALVLLVLALVAAGYTAIAA